MQGRSVRLSLSAIRYRKDGGETGRRRRRYRQRVCENDGADRVRYDVSRPASPLSGGDEKAIKRYNKIRNEAIAKYDEILAGFNRRLSNANHSKNPKARVESLLTEIKFFRKDNEKDTDEKIKSLQEQFSQAFLESYSSFEPERLQRIIESNGDSLSTQKMLPMYRDVFARPPYVKNGSTKDIADFACCESIKSHR